MKLKVNSSHLVVKEVDVTGSVVTSLIPKKHDGVLKTVEVIEAHNNSDFSKSDIILHEKDIMYIEASDFGDKCFYYS